MDSPLGLSRTSGGDPDAIIYNSNAAASFPHERG